MWAQKHIVSGEKLQELADVYIGEMIDFEFNSRIRTQTSKFIPIDQIPPNYDNPRTVFVYGHRVRAFSSRVSSFRNPFVLITHNSDENIIECPEFCSILDHPLLINWFAQNACFHHDKLNPLPIGIANQMWKHGNLSFFQNSGISKPNNVYFNFNINTNETARSSCFNMLKDKIPFLPDVSADQNIQRLSTYKFCICPIGNGQDTHRFWEALYTHTIPIVLDSPFIRVLNTHMHLPMIIVDKWSELDPSNLTYKCESEYFTDISFETYRRVIQGYAPVTVVLTSLVNFQEYILDSVRNLIVHGNKRVVVITEPEFFTRFSEFPTVQLVDKSSLIDEFGFESKSTLDKGFRNGFWHLASARFFILYAYLKTHNVNRCLHIENDVMVYANADTVRWNPDRMAGAYDGSGRMIPSVVWIPTPASLRTVLERYDFANNDMANFGKADLERLPIFPDNWTLASPPFVHETASVTENYPSYGYVFDAAAMGQYLGGLDPHVFGATPPKTYVSPDCCIKYNHYEFIWKDGRPFIVVAGTPFPIFNLHIHSKNLKAFQTTEPMKTVVLVLASKGEPYNSFLANWKTAKVPEGFKVYFYFLTPGIAEIEIRNGNEIHIPGDESFVPGTHVKTIAAFRYILKTERFDYLLRPNISSAFNFEKLKEWMIGKPFTNHGFGVWNCNSFLSGCGYMLTRDLVERFVAWDSPVRPVLVDDMMLRDFMYDQRVPHVGWNVDNLGCTVPNIMSQTVFHFRFMTNRDDRTQDIINQRNAIEYFNSSSS